MEMEAEAEEGTLAAATSGAAANGERQFLVRAALRALWALRWGRPLCCAGWRLAAAVRVYWAGGWERWEGVHRSGLPALAFWDCRR